MKILEKINIIYIENKYMKKSKDQKQNEEVGEDRNIQRKRRKSRISLPLSYTIHERFFILSIFKNW